MNHLDLFSGIGGFSLGLKRVFNIKHSYFSEIDKYAIDVYKHNFKNSTYVKSVTDIRGRDLPRIDVITFGSPCQDFSLAGKRKGMDGERSSLITEAIRLIKECRPSFFIWENVKGTFSSNSGEDFWAIIQTFANIGDYRLEWQLLNTKWFLPQNRERIYLIGCLGEGSGKQIFPITENSKEINELQGQQANTCKLTTRYEAGGNGSYIIERKLDAQKVIKHDIPEIVSVRKYEVNIKELQKVLSDHKQKTIKQISIELNLPKTQVEHWFRKDKSFSIPPKDIWHKLKEVLDIKDNSFDKSITTYIEKESVFEKTNRVYDTKGIAPTLTSTSADEKIIVGDFRNDEGFRPRKDGDSPCLATRRCSETDISTMPPIIKGQQTVRRLTPIECERLQGFPDDWTKTGKELGTISDSQRYKMCGNAVTVDVVEAVAKKIKESLSTKI